MHSEDICWLTATALANAIRAGDVSSLDAVRAVLDRINAVDAKLGAFATVPREATLQAAQDADRRRERGDTLGPLHGIPMSIKDILFTKGLRTTGGSRLYENFVPDQDAIVVERLKAAGAVILGKTATPEFCHKTVTDSPLLGTTRNPWDTSRTTAGSSGGSAAAVAAGLGPLSIGTDGGGSIRLPAAFCGVVGLKPSAGSVPQYPGFAGWDFLGHTGPLARTVEDVGLAMRIIAGPDGRDPSSLFAPAPPAFVEFRRLRVAFARSLNYLEPEPEVDAALAATVDGVRDLGLEPREARVSWTDPDLLYRVIVTSELAAALGHHLPRDADRMDPSLVKMLEFGAARRATDLVRAFEWRRAFAREIFAWFNDYDLMIVPTAPVTAFPLGMIGPTTISGRKTSPYDWFSWTWPFNLSGQPAISLPIWGRGELPVGIQIVGRPGADELVLAFAAALERQVGGPTARRPRLSDATRTAG